MSSKQQDEAKPDVSSVLFVTADGQPMSFFLRPGPVKRKLQPLIKSGGGMLCSVQKSGVILLINPEERGNISETTAHRYVSTHFIYDCIEKKERLNIEDYRLNTEVVPRQSTRLNNNKGGSSGLLGGRVAYTPEEDAAILNYISKHKADTGGNRLWQAMEKQNVTSHSWQSMKYHYRVQLAKKQYKNGGNQDTDVQQPPSEDAASQSHSPATKPLQTNPVETELAQIDAEPIAAEITRPEDVEAEKSNSPQPGSPSLDPQSASLPIPAESKEPETAMPPQKEAIPEDSLQFVPDTLTPEIPEQPKQRASRKLEQPQRRLTRRQLDLEMSSSPEPYGKKLRSSSPSADNLSKSHQPTKKTKSAIKPVEKHTTTGSPPSMRARGRSVAESEEDEGEGAAISESPQTEHEKKRAREQGEEEEPESLPEKKKQKKKLGILELATKEFEDESESSEDQTPDLEHPAETATVQPTSAEPLLPSSEVAGGPTSAQSEPGPSLQEKAQQLQAVISRRVPEPAAPGPLQAASRAHMFIFDSESQEAQSQCVVGDSTSALSQPQPPVNKDAALSLTQVQLEEDKQRIRQLMNQTNQDLASVTKALLKTSGDISAALDLLLDPSSFSGPFWNKNDDSLLLSADSVLLLELQEKYSEEEVAKRIVFLEAKI